MAVLGSKCLLQVQSKAPFLQSTYSLIHLGEHWAAAKPPSERVALHSVGFYNLGEREAAAKPPSERVALHSVGFL